MKPHLLILSLLVATPVLAHTVKVSGDIEVTFHILDPQANKPISAWFALKQRKDQKIISLSQCNCQLAIYSLPRTPKDKPLLTPTLKAVNTEDYQNIPGAEITFPKTGKYHVTLSGSPKAPAKFNPFSLTDTITVSKPEQN